MPFRPIIAGMRLAGVMNNGSTVLASASQTLALALYHQLSFCKKKGDACHIYIYMSVSQASQPREENSKR